MGFNLIHYNPLIWWHYSVIITIDVYMMIIIDIIDDWQYYIWVECLRKLGFFLHRMTMPRQVTGVHLSLGKWGSFGSRGTVGQPEKWHSQVWGSQKPGDYILYCVYIVYIYIYIYINIYIYYIYIYIYVYIWLPSWTLFLGQQLAQKIWKTHLTWPLPRHTKRYPYSLNREPRSY